MIHSTVLMFGIPGRTGRTYYVALRADHVATVSVHDHGEPPPDPNDPAVAGEPLYDGAWDPADAWLEVIANETNQEDHDLTLQAHASVALWATLTVLGPGHVRAWLARIALPWRARESPQVLDDALRGGLLRMIAARRCVDVERCAALALTTDARRTTYFRF